MFARFRRAKLALAALSAGLLAMTAVQSSAETCSQAPVSAQGEPARFQWIAKAKARANWRAKVRAKSDLGPDFASWRIATSRTDQCSTTDGRVVCVFTGTPCKK